MFSGNRRSAYFTGALLFTAGVLLICLFAAPPAAAACAAAVFGAAVCAVSILSHKEKLRGSGALRIALGGLLSGAALLLALSALQEDALGTLLALSLVSGFTALGGMLLNKEAFNRARALCLLAVLLGAGLGFAFSGLSVKGALAALLFASGRLLFIKSSTGKTRPAVLAGFCCAALGPALGALVFHLPVLPLPDSPLWWAGPLCAGAGAVLMGTSRIDRRDAVWMRAAAPFLPLLFFRPLFDSDTAVLACMLMSAGGALFDRFVHAPVRYVTGEERELLRDPVPVHFYNGVLCLRHPFQRFTSAASFCFLLINSNRGRDRRYHANAETLRHEYGHTRQAKALGVFRYWRYIAIPSMTGYYKKVPYAAYYNQPWERGADVFGHVERTVHTPGSEREWDRYFIQALPKRKRAKYIKQEGNTMIKFLSDYQEGACPEIMAALEATNLEQSEGYGEDAHCARARALIRTACQREDADVHFLIGGTSCNKILISAALRPFEGALCVQSAHINSHETGTIEASGHKVIALPSPDGKITAQQIEETMAAHWADETHEHIVRPGLVYITHPTEGGLLYTLDELKALRKACDKWDLYLYLDGARLGYGLAAEGAEITLPDIAKYTDAFYIGGTKVGALFGEAMVLLAPSLKKDFRYMIKNQGGLLAKGRLQGVQFETLFTDGLYQRLAAHAVNEALRLKAALRENGIPLLFDSPTNQQFPLLTPEQRRKLAEKYAFESWGPAVDGREPVRFCMSWATRPEHVDALIGDLRTL